MPIRAATVAEVTRQSGPWAFVDLGFAEKSKSCGVAIDDEEPVEVRFSDLCRKLREEVQGGVGAMNLLLEAPLSATFDQLGNPTGRAVEKRGSTTRYWYVGLGCSVLVAATYLLRSLLPVTAHREVRLIEGLASFKPKGEASSHTGDVAALRDVAWGRNPQLGRVVGPRELARHGDHRLESAFAVAGMDFGIPPVVVLGQ